MFGHKPDEKVMADLKERVETLERQFQGMKMEWTDVLDRMVVMKRRITKQAQYLREHPDTGDTETPGEHVSDEDVAYSGGGMTPAQRVVQERIMQRRNRSQ